MPKDKKNRLVYVLKYMWEHTDEDNQTTLNQIVQHLMTLGIEATPRTVGYDLDQLVELGFDIVCIRSTQNRYFLGSRTFEIPELKLMIDAIQAAHFISAERAEQMIGKLALLASSEQAEVLKRNLYVTKQKGDNRNLLYTVDVLNMAINQQKRVAFCYYEYDRSGKKQLKHGGAEYVFSPYTLAWNMDNYYVVGYSEKHDKVIKYRVDKICRVKLLDEGYIPMPEGFDMAEFCDSMFLMYGDRMEQVTLRCRYEITNKIIDKFGEDIEIKPIDDDFFEITENVMTGSTFYSWVFNYGGKIMIVAPDSVKEDFRTLLSNFKTY